MVIQIRGDLSGINSRPPPAAAAAGSLGGRFVGMRTPRNGALAGGAARARARLYRGGMPSSSALSAVSGSTAPCNGFAVESSIAIISAASLFSFSSSANR